MKVKKRIFLLDKKAQNILYFLTILVSGANPIKDIWHFKCPN